MIKIILFAVIAILSVAQTGSTGAEIKVMPVVFAHPDEMVKGEGFIVLADRREFAVFAFINAAGFDEEAPGKEMTPVRIKVRQMTAANLAKSPEKLEAWRKYYQDKRLASFQYEDYALSLSADYPFKRIRPDSELQYRRTVVLLDDFPTVLNDFWKNAQLEEVWNEVKPDYLAEIHKYSFEKMKRQLSFLWEYLRIKRNDNYIIVHAPNPLDARYNSIGARYENYYYSVESTGASAYDLNVHEYLHSIVNPLVKTNYEAYRDKLDAYFQAGKTGPLSKSYQNLEGFTAECMVRALDYRLRAKLDGREAFAKRVESQIAEMSIEGLTLTQPFYQALTDYEQSGKAFDVSLATIFDRLAPLSK
jgi:hypothetical protein